MIVRGVREPHRTSLLIARFVQKLLLTIAIYRHIIILRQLLIIKQYHLLNSKASNALVWVFKISFIKYNFRLQILVFVRAINSRYCFIVIPRFEALLGASLF